MENYNGEFEYINGILYLKFNGEKPDGLIIDFKDTACKEEDIHPDIKVKKVDTDDINQIHNGCLWLADDENGKTRLSCISISSIFTNKQAT